MSDYFGNRSKSETYTFMGVQKPMVENLVDKNKDVVFDEIIESVSRSIKPNQKIQWDIGSFEAKGEPTPISLESLKKKLLSVVDSIDVDIKEGSVVGKCGDNYKHIVDLTSYCLEILKNYKSEKR